ncbi:MAG: hypothetical protein U5J99_13765 [Parvularculaceae bacterium]|nr:hypothetical protein [Parvularculaceae bacterium]
MRRMFAAAALALLVAAPAIAAPLGAQVVNRAQVDYTIGATSISATTADAIFTIEAQRTPSTITFFRYSPSAPGAVSTQLNGSEFQNGSGGPFQPVGPLVSAGGSPVNTAAPVPLIEASAYFAGEPVIVRVTDPGQNGDPSLVETIIATIATENGDFVTLRLFESGPDTGEFFAWVPTSTGALVSDDAVLTIAHGAGLTARYQDPFDATEVSTDTAAVDPFGRVFDSLTGALIDGAIVTIVDDASGLPATVFGIDGVSAYPSTVITGSTVIDAGGIQYDLGPGEFRFPLMLPGTYRVLVTPPAGYSGPSSVQPPGFDALVNAPFVIIPGSYGQPFVLTGFGDLEFDYPLDPSTDVVLTKAADVATASIGDFVRYRITMENRAASPAPARIVDTLPAGQRYQTGSARAGAAALPDPQVSADGRTLTFTAGTLDPGATLTISYIVEVTPGARLGEAVNVAQSVGPSGAPVSNRAEAAVDIIDDFLRSSLTIVGRVIEDGCEDGQKGKGVEGVRLYLENGFTTVTDKDGLYHFEGVSPRTHVVQVDEESLPDAYDLVLCKDNTRYAGAAYSQFVDARGGSVWRANFHVKKVRADKPAPLDADGSTADDAAFNPDTEYRGFDKKWLDGQTGGNAFAYPGEGVTPSAASLNLGVKHDVALRPTLYLNGQEVPPENFAGRDVNLLRTMALTHWRGVDLREGDNSFEVRLRNEAGVEVARLKRSVPYVSRVERAALLEERSSLFADGKSRPVIALHVTDGAGRPVRAGRLLSVEVSEPYRTVARGRAEDRNALDAPLSTQSAIPVGQGGVALVELEPTVETGPIRIEVALENGRSRSFAAYVKPAPRGWIVVGLAEGEGGFENQKEGAAPNALDIVGDGRVAGFAKGVVKGGWLVTLAGDTARKRGREDDTLFLDVNPDERYPLFGDRSRQEFEAQSRYPVYLKAEKDAFRGVFGDFDTGLSESKLSRYSRRLSGLGVDYQGERFEFSGFASDTNQAFVRDELAADGTSGRYKLSAAPIVRNSETIAVETRDRFRPDVILATTTLARYADYEIDYATGEIVFRLPVPAADAAFNPNVILVDYETSAPVERALTAGGRGAVKFLGGRGEAGATFIHEEGAGADAETTDLAGADVVVNLTDATEIRAEYARSFTDGATGATEAEAILAEVAHTGDRVDAKAYFSEVGADFGLEQQTSAQVGVRRYGAEIRVRIDDFDGGLTTENATRSIEAKAYREENLATGAAREIAEVALRQDGALTSGSVGLRGVREDPQTGPEREGLFVTASARQRFEKLGLSVRAAREQSIAGDNASALFPTRTSVGFDQRLFDGFTLSATHEILSGDAVSQSNTTVGLKAEPWTGAAVTLAGDRLSQDTGERIGATFGIDQQVKLSDKWTGSLGMARREDLKTDGGVDIVDDIVPDAARSPFEQANGAFTSLYVGAGFRDKATTGSGRFEVRKSDEGQRYMVATAAARELSEQLSFGAAGRFEQNNNDLSPDERRFEARIGASWRPRDEGLIVFNRLDVKQQSVDLEARSWKAVHNLALNAQALERLQLSFNHGIKYAAFSASGSDLAGVTQLAGFEARYDVTKRIDLGVHAEALYSWNSGAMQYSYGPSIGASPAKNVWLSLGWNFAGFNDEDFAAAEYSANGPYLKLRIKFDQHTAKGLLDAISPRASGTASP